MENRRPPAGFKPVISKRTEMVKGQRSRINTKGKKSTQLSLLKSSSQSHATPCCCKVCGKSFHYMGSLIKHVQTHTKDKETLCGVCGKHMESTEEIFGVVEKTIAAYQEDVVRLQRLLDNLLQPEIKHRADCSAVQSGKENGFKTVKSKRKEMVKGQRSRINVKGKKSTQLSLLKSTSQSHATPCCCKVCGKYFNYMGSLIKHVQTHTKDKEKNFMECVESKWSPQ
ncbi:unnamed protein product, partial [Coregonus sp. 'balchen']